MSDKPAVDSIKQQFDLTGRVALVTGGGGHLGAAFASALAEMGAQVVVTSRTQERADAAAEVLPSPRGAKHLGVVLDQVKPESIDQCIETIHEQVGPIDILVNNGHHFSIQQIHEATHEEFTEQLSNATAYFLLARHVHDAAVERGAAASIIMIGSMYGMVGSYPDAYEGIVPASPVAYHTLKGGIIHLTRHLAVYWAKDHVRVNCLSPGPFPAQTITPKLVERLESQEPHETDGPRQRIERGFATARQ